jgi:hypothetical protein
MQSLKRKRNGELPKSGSAVAILSILFSIIV